MESIKILISPSSFGECGSEPRDLLVRNGFKTVMNPYGRRLTAEEVIDLASDCEGILAGVEPLNAAVLGSLPKLRCISRVGVGMQNVDLQVAEAKGIVVRNTPGGPSRAVAELTLGLTLALLRRIPLADRNLRMGLWQKEMGFLLHGKSVGIVGLGSIGRQVAELFLGLGCEVMAAEPAPDDQWLNRFSVPVVPLEDLLRESDIVSLHLALGPGEGPLIGASEIERMKEGAFLINLARGDAVDEEALYQALSSGRIAGAALDVFVDEPYKGRLTDLEQVVLTPHLGSYAREARLMMELQAVENLIDALKGSGVSGK
jgi:D-3-phosphoglycerate dehydrogenase